MDVLPFSSVLIDRTSSNYGSAILFSEERRLFF
jgi:hypothetical protein